VLIFILLFLLSFISCASPQPQREQNDFYLGLLVSDNDAEKIRLFENALSNSNIHVRRAAADQLAIFMFNGTELSARTIEQIRREASPKWINAFEIIESAPNREKTLSFMFGYTQNMPIPFAEARLYILRELQKKGVFFSEHETAAIEGHYAVSRLRYNDALSFFRTFQVNGVWPSQMPELFVEYPNLINDLGRTFQFTQSGSEGIDLFLQWETSLRSNAAGTSDDLRYRLLFFAARISRRAGQGPQAVALFERALPLAPDYEQQDACIWYILDLSMGGPINVIMDRLERLIPLWHSGNYYSTLMERYLHRLVTARDWGRIIRTFELIKDINIGIKAGYSWVIARILEEGFLSADERRLAALAANISVAEPAAFMQITYDSVGNIAMSGVYYRMKSADFLGLPFLIFSENNSSRQQDETTSSDALQFLLGFFRFGAADYANPYIRSMERYLTPDELRAVASALDEAEMYPQSMRVVALYINRDGYERTRRDLELMYPRPYRELIETHSIYFDIEPALFFGLVRTESAFQSAVVSRAGAVGLSQLMPATAREQADRIRRTGGPNFFGPDDILDSTDPLMNIYIGTHYLNHQRNSLGDMVLALMAYNGGHTRVRRWRAASDLPVDLLVETVPIFETRDYGRRVPVIGRIYRELYYN
jgi:soluble lytic murein transglycosylase